MSQNKLRLGVDTGGTFTDAVVMDEETGDILIDKVSSTPSDPSISLHQVISQALHTVGTQAEGVTFLAHGTTVATNCIIEGKTVPCGLLTTHGFRDILEIARQIKPEPYNLQFEKPRPLVPRQLCLEATERVDAEGRILVPLDQESVRQAARRFRQEGVEAVAICFLHSYLNPCHEKAAADILKQELPGTFLTMSSEVCPEFREYFRASTTIVNAAIAPIVSNYLERMEGRLKGLSFAGHLCVMQSNGGICTSEVARRKPVHLVESGPAAGVIAAAYIGIVSGSPNVISLDIGGTTAKVGLIQDGTPKISNEFEVGAKATGPTSHAKATGYPIKSSVIDLVEIGAGGGSIGWVDSGGALRVGPHSAGAEPGPACYCRGGVLPTLTDANLVLGRIDPDYFLGGKMKLSTVAALRAIEQKIAEPLNISVTAAALGVVEIANSNMIEALRLISVKRGFDPRDFALVAFGGAGPLHANALAAEFDLPKVIIPLSPGVSSALGLLLADTKHYFSRTYLHRLPEANLEELMDAFAEFESQGRQLLLQEGIPSERQSFQREIDLRYAGQSFELKLAVPSGILTAAIMDSLSEAFHRAHEQAYGHSAPGEPVEIVNLRVTAHGHIPKPRQKRISAKSNGNSALKRCRDVCFRAEEGYIETSIYDRYRLSAEAVLNGPAIVEEFDSTVVIHPGYRATADVFGSLYITKQ